MVLSGHLSKTLLSGLALLITACGGSTSTSHDVEGLRPHYFASTQSQECCIIIAHAGGAIDGNAYTNSREAIELSLIHI